MTTFAQSVAMSPLWPDQRQHSRKVAMEIRTVGDAAKYTRKLMGLNQNEMAKILGVSNVHLCKVEQNKGCMSSKLADRFLLQFGVDIRVWAWCENERLNKGGNLHRHARALSSQMRKLIQSIANPGEVKSDV